MNRFVSFLCVLCLIGTILTTGFAEGSSGYQQAYIAMLEEFERGNFADAYIAAKIVYETNQKYEQIVSYYNYLTALQVYLPKEQYKEAYDTFQALSLRKFQKSEGYAAYALGCQCEKDMDYATAVEYFKIAFTNSIDEAYEKIQDCQKKSNEMKYNQAMELQRQKEFLAAAEIFESLTNDYPDAQEKAKACYYDAATEHALEGKINEAAELFASLGDYKDSIQKAIQIRAWASGESSTAKLGLRMEASTSTSITIGWDDETDLETFAVTYMPTGIETQTVTITTYDTSVVLESLLPNTQYTISVSSPSNSSYFDKNNYWTSQAAPVTDYNVRRVTIIPRLLDRISIRSLGMDSVINTTGNSDKCVELSEKEGYPVPDRKPSETIYDMYISLAFFADEFASPQQAEITYVLRIDGNVSAGKSEMIQLPEKGYKIINANLTDLMDVLYENARIDGSELTIDVYLNGQHMNSKIIPIGK